MRRYLSLTGKAFAKLWNTLVDLGEPPVEGEPAAYDRWFAHVTDVNWHDLVEPWRE